MFVLYFSKHYKTLIFFPMQNTQHIEMIAAFLMAAYCVGPVLPLTISFSTFYLHKCGLDQGTRWVCVHTTDTVAAAVRTCWSLSQLLISMLPSQSCGFCNIRYFRLIFWADSRLISRLRRDIPLNSSANQSGITKHRIKTFCWWGV